MNHPAPPNSGRFLARLRDSFRERGFWWIVGGAVLVHAALGMDAARQWTPTHDEYWHLPYGLYYWQTGDLQADPINPPLVRMWAALPLLFSKVRLAMGDVEPTPYAVGDAFLQAAGPQYRTLFWQGRMMILVWGLAGAVLVAVWARRWYGDAAGIVAVLLWTGCPTLLSQAAVVTHDLPLSVATLATFAALTTWRQRPTWLSACLFGGLLGVAQLTKLTAVLLYPLCMVLWCILPRSSTSVPWWRQGTMFLSAWLLSWMVLCAAYGFEGVGSIGDTSPATTFPGKVWSFISPRPYRQAWRRLESDLSNVHPVFLNGEWRQGSFPLYYGYAFLYKLPPGTLLLGAVSCLTLSSRECGWERRRRGVALLLAFLAFVVPASFSPNQIGLRYVLPAYPVWIIWSSQAVHWFQGQTFWRRRWWLALLVGSVPLALRYHPHHLAYFNVLTGGPIEGRNHLVDSNLDWGQDLDALATALPTLAGQESVSVAYFGSVPPTSVGLKGGPPPPYQPTPGWHAISVNFVQGRPHTLRLPDGSFHRLDLDVYGYFRFFEPVARVGYSIDVYRLTPEDVARYRSARAAAEGL